MLTITREDIWKLRRRFEAYCKTAEQYQFPLLLIIDAKMKRTLRYYSNPDRVVDQENMNAMFRTVLHVIGEDNSAYF